MTRAKLSAPKGEGALALEDFDGARRRARRAGRPRGARRAGGTASAGVIDRLVGTFGRANVCVELQRHFRRDEESDNHTLRDLASAFRVPVMATNGVRFATPEARPLYDVLTCIRHKTTLAHAGRRLTFNAERYLKPPRSWPGSSPICRRRSLATETLAERLEFTLADLGYRFPDYPVPAGEIAVVVSAEDWRKSARGNATGRITIGRARRFDAS